MNARGIAIGTKVELELFNNLGSKLGKTFTGEFMDIVSDMEVIIFSAGQGPAPLSFSKNIRARAFFHHQMHGPLNFRGALTLKEETKHGIKFHIRIDDDFQEIQKREYYRPDCFLKAEYRFVDGPIDNDNEVICETPYKTTTTKNISFTGVCILLDNDDGITEDGWVDLKVWLNDKISIKIACKVMRVMVSEINVKKEYQLGLSIEYINENDTAILTKYITRSLVNPSLFLGETPFNI